jgi:hypothetical protein
MVASGTGVPSVPVTIPLIAEVVTPWASSAAGAVATSRSKAKARQYWTDAVRIVTPMGEGESTGAESVYGTACRNYVKRVGIWPPP